MHSARVPPTGKATTKVHMRPCIGSVNGATSKPSRCLSVAKPQTPSPGSPRGGLENANGVAAAAVGRLQSAGLLSSEKDKGLWQDTWSSKASASNDIQLKGFFGLVQGAVRNMLLQSNTSRVNTEPHSLSPKSTSPGRLLDKRSKQVQAQATTQPLIQGVLQARRALGLGQQVPGIALRQLDVSPVAPSDHTTSKITPTAPAHPRTNLASVTFGIAHTNGGRPYMEDRHIVIPDFKLQDEGGRALEDGVHRSFVGVFDGHDRSALAAEMAATLLPGKLASHPAMRQGRPSDIALSYFDSFQSLDEEILELAEQRARLGAQGPGGSTALSLLRVGRDLFVAHAGDSRAVMSHGGVAEALTQDHTPAVPEEAERIVQAGGCVIGGRGGVIRAALYGHPSAISMSRALGDISYKRPLPVLTCQPDVRHVEARPEDDFVILATDGLWDKLTDQQAVDCVRDVLYTVHRVHELGVHQEAALREAAESAAVALLRAAQLSPLVRFPERGPHFGYTDNTSVVVMMLNWC